jgi:hypothetical protein
MRREEPSMDPKHEPQVEQPAVTGGETQTEGALALQSEQAPAVTREQRRSRRKRAVRARTISVKRMTKRELELGRMLYPEVEDVEHPRTRSECGDAPVRARSSPASTTCISTSPLAPGRSS